MSEHTFQELTALPLHELKKYCEKRYMPFPRTKKEAIARIITQQLFPKVLAKCETIELHDKGGLISRPIHEVIELVCETEIVVPIAPPERKRLRKAKHKKINVQIVDSDEEP